LARPTKLYLDYFSHDTDATNDEKMDMFRSMYGNDGYAFYFIILEKVYRTENAMIDLSKNIFVVGLAKKLMISVEKFYEMLETAFELEMFDRDLFESEKKLTSNGIQKRFADVMKQRNQWKKTKETNQKEFSNEKTSNNYEFSNEKTIGKTRQKKGKEIEKEKENEIKNNNVDSSESLSASFSSDIIFLTDLLISEIKNNNPQAKTPANLNNWQNDIRLLISDGYNLEQIEKVIKWCQGDDFWKSNILSAKKLREKMGTLIIQMGRGTDAKPWSNNKRPVIEVAKFEGYSENDITPERIEEVRGKAREVEELLRMRKVR
jgi:hypothetical protein